MDSRPLGSGRPTDRTVTAVLTITPVTMMAMTVMDPMPMNRNPRRRGQATATGRTTRDAIGVPERDDAGRMPVGTDTRRTCTFGLRRRHG